MKEAKNLPISWWKVSLASSIDAYTKDIPGK